MRRDHIGSVPLWAAALGLYVVLAGVAFASAWSDPVNRSIAPGLDSMNTMWFMRWVPYALVHGHNPLLSTHMNYPAGVNVMWNNADGLPAVGLLTAPLQLFLSMPAVFDVVTTLAVALSAWTAFMAIRRHVDHPLAAIAGGLVYGFGPYMSAQWAGHVGLVLAFVPPLMLIAIEEIAVYQRREAWRLGAGLGALAAFQVLLAEEMLATEVVAAVIVLGALAALRRREVPGRIAYASRALVPALAVFVVVAGPPIAEQFLGPQRLHGALRSPGIFVNDLLNFIQPTTALLVHPLGIVGGAGWTGNGTEWNGYLGVPLILSCVGAAVACRRRLDVQVAAISGLLFALLSLGPEVHLGGRPILPGLWHAGSLPILQNILPARLMLFGDLAAGWLLAVLLDRLLQPRLEAPRAAGAALVAGLTFVTLLPQLPALYDQHEVPSFFTSGAAAARVAPGSVVLLAPIPVGRDYNTRYAYDALLWQVVSGMRFRVPWFTAIVPGPGGGQLAMPDLGPVGNSLVSLQDGGSLTSPAAGSRTALVQDLRNRRVATVILGPMPRREEALAYLGAVLGPGEDVGGVTVWQVR